MTEMKDLRRGDAQDRIERIIATDDITVVFKTARIMEIIDEIVEELESREDDPEDQRSLDEVLGLSALEDEHNVYFEVVSDE